MRARSSGSDRSGVAPVARPGGADRGQERALSVYGFGELDTLVPAYAATVHRARSTRA